MYILLVNKDDNETQKIKDILDCFYKDNTYLVAKNIIEANEVVKNKQVSLALVELEDKKILDLATKVIKNNPVINIIFMSKTKDYCYDAFKIHASGYILKPITKEVLKDNLDHLRFQLSSSTNRVRVECFGKFEIYVDEKPVKFGRNKTKELLAYLVDRNGTMCNNGDLLSILWPDDEPNMSLKQQVRNLIYDLNKSLKKFNAENIIIRKNNLIGIDKTKIDCDYYNFQMGDPKALQSFRGEYMIQYSDWSYTMECSLQKYFYEE